MPVFHRRHVEMLQEGLSEIAPGVKSHHLGDLRNFPIAGGQQFGGFVEPDDIYPFVWRAVREGSDLSIQGGPAYIHQPGHCVDIQAGVVQMAENDRV